MLIVVKNIFTFVVTNDRELSQLYACPRNYQYYRSSAKQTALRLNGRMCRADIRRSGKY